MAENKAKTTAKKSKAAPPVVIHGVKGFNLDMTCLGFQFEADKTYRHDGDVRICKSGFHCVTGHPLGVFGFYAPAGSRFFRVEISGKTHSDDNVKTAAKILKVGEEIGISGLVAEAIAWVTSRTTPEGETATGDQGASSATGYQGASSATGSRGASSATGDQGASSATGYRGASSATGSRGAAISTGYEGRVMGADGNVLFAVERDQNSDIVSIAAGIVGRDGLKAETWYVARAGQFVAAT